MLRDIKRPGEPWIGYGSLVIIAWSLLVLLIAVGPADAGCANFTDGSLSAPPPLVELCFGEQCETTRQEWICSTAQWVSTEFSNGLRVERNSLEDYGSINGQKIPAERLATLTCRPLDDNPDACSAI
jgi:hypothetical protein